MKLSRISVSLYVLLIFCSGIALGALGHRMYMVTTVSAKPEEWRKQYLNEMQTRLHLRAEQMTNLNAILDETRTRFHEVHERTRPEYESIKHQQTDKVRSMLDDVQRAEYEKMRQEREAREKAQGKPPGPGL